MKLYELLNIMTPTQYYEIRLQEESTHWNLFCGYGREYFSGYLVSRSC